MEKNFNRQAFIYAGDGRPAQFAKMGTHLIGINYEKPNKTDVWESSKKGCESVTIMSNYRNIHAPVSRPPSMKYNLPKDFQLQSLDMFLTGQGLLRNCLRRIKN